MNTSIESSHVRIAEPTAKNVVTVELTGKLEKSDYTQFVPKIEQMLRWFNKARMLVVLHDFHGWTAGALWEDIKFDIRHFNHIEKLAIVGESKWEKGVAVFCKPFTSAKVKYFDAADLDAARVWIAK
jgi:hypothetical protein